MLATQSAEVEIDHLIPSESLVWTNSRLLKIAEKAGELILPKDCLLSYIVIGPKQSHGVALIEEEGRYVLVAREVGGPIRLRDAVESDVLGDYRMVIPEGLAVELRAYWRDLLLGVRYPESGELAMEVGGAMIYFACRIREGGRLQAKLPPMHGLRENGEVLRFSRTAARLLSMVRKDGGERDRVCRKLEGELRSRARS